MLSQILVICCDSLEVLRVKDCNWISKTTLSLIGKHLFCEVLLVVHFRIQEKIHKPSDGYVTHFQCCLRMSV